MEQPRVQFKTLHEFPTDEKIETEAFLKAARDVVAVIETFGKLFTPVVNDMNGNIKKLTTSQNQKRAQYLEDLVVQPEGVDKFVADALLWLKRGLQLICSFFENIYYDQQRSEVLKPHLKDAYEKSLKKYHGFIVQKTVQIIYGWVPTRSELIGKGAVYEENIKVLESYLPAMRTQLNRIEALLRECNFDNA